MPQIKINFGEVPDNSDPVPRGVYSVNVSAVTMRQSEGAEFPYLNWDFEIMDHPEHAGRHVFLVTSLSPKALFRLKEVIGVLGFDPTAEIEFVVDDDDGTVTSPDFIGAVARANVIHEKYQGRPIAKCDFVLPLQEQRRVEAPAGPARPAAPAKAPPAVAPNRPAQPVQRRVV